MRGAKVLVVDAGGRGNAIAHAIARSRYVEKVYLTPGNAGSCFFDKCELGYLDGKPISSIKDIENITKFAKNAEVDLCVIGPERPLSLGLVNRLEEEGIPAFGPKKEAAILESSKCWTKELQRDLGIPIPSFAIFDNSKEAMNYIEEFYKKEVGKNLVIKADGLAEGKGVYVCNSKSDAFVAVNDIMVKKRFGDAGNKVLIEERLDNGIEVAFQAITDGETVLSFNSVKDYKKAYEERDIPENALKQMLYYNERMIGKFILEDPKRLYEEGKLFNPNTGGMGAVFPHPYVNKHIEKLIMDEVVIPTVKGFREKTGIKFKGIIYPVIMLCKEDDEIIPKVLEINVRECDPGAQAKYPMLHSDLYILCKAVAEEKLHEFKEIEWEPGSSIAVCAVSGKIWGGPKGSKHVYVGYPHEDHLTNLKISGLEDALRNGRTIYANGIAKSEQGYETTGGRVFTAQEKGSTVREARDKLYSWISGIKFDGMRYRTDIGLDFVNNLEI
jgi:phosphoribosylamine--glycine ligase